MNGANTYCNPMSGMSGGDSKTPLPFYSHNLDKLEAISVTFFFPIIINFANGY
jgi:hypothetical protein